MEKMNILIVEDERIVARDIQHSLENLGYAVPAIASSGETAIEKAAEIQPNLVLMDIKLRGAMDGVEAAQKIHATFDIPVVYLTAYADEETLQRAKITAPFGYILKPFEEREIHSAIQMALYKHKMERKLKEREEHFRALIENSSDIIIVLDGDGTVQYASSSIERVLGYTPEETIGNNIFEFLHPDDESEAVNDFAQVIQDRVALWSREGRYRHKNGSWRILEIIGHNQLDDSVMAGIIVNARDATERKRAEEALQQRNRELALLNQIGQAFTVTLDLDQVLVTVLEEVRRLLDVAACSIWLIYPETNELVCQQAIGPQSEVVRGWRLVLGEGLAGWVARSGESLIVSDTQTDERHFKNVDQQTGVEMRAILSAPLRVKQDVIGVLQITDTAVDRFRSTDLILVESLAASAAIAIDNARLVEALHHYTAELETRNEDLDAFAHTVAHDLKNPVGLVVGFANVLEKDCVTMPRERLQGYLRIIARNGHKINNLIDELLLLAGVRQIKVALMPLDMASIVVEAQERLAHLIEEYQAEVILPDTWPETLGYGPWVEEVWVNYLSNTLKYGGRPPRVELGATLQPDGMVRFWVRDNGPGLTVEEQGRLFTPFTQLDQVRAQGKGHGLGLSIVRRIVEKLGGQVGVESKVGRGSVFTFTLPGLDGEAQGRTQT